jgi:glycosyltransferase involved in cell wall biosynthesis
VYFAQVYGGVARQITYLSSRLRERGHDVEVLLVCRNDELEQALRRAGLPFCVLRTPGKKERVRAIARYVRRVRRRKPDVIYGNLMADNLLATVARAAHPKARLVWGVRSTGLGRLEGRDRPTRPLAEVQRLLSFMPALVISNSHAGARDVTDRGYPADRVIVIENGVDVSAFAPDAEARERVRAEWGVEPSSTLVGTVARISPEKGQLTFLEAGARLTDGDRDLRFACIGADPPPRKREFGLQLLERAADLGISDRVIWPGWRSDMPAVMNALDLLVLASDSEGTPNAVAEAMACETVCVATDVGDTGRVLGEEEFLVPPRDAAALAAACERALDEAADCALGARLRERVRQRYSIESYVERTETALQGLL